MISEALLVSWFRQARNFCGLGEFDRAELLCRRILTLVPDHPPAVLMLSEILVQRGDGDVAIMMLESLIRTAETSPAVHFALGNAYLHAGNLNEAATNLKRAAELALNFPAAYNNLGLVLRQLGDRDGAMSAFELAILLDCNFIEPRLTLADFLLDHCKFNEAAGQLRKALTIEPKSAIIHYRLGITLHRQRHFEKAIRCQLIAVSLQPDFAEAYVAGGLSLCSSGRAEEAVHLIEGALSLRLDSASAWHALGTALRALGRFTLAVEAYEKAIALKPDHGEAFHALSCMRGQTSVENNLGYLRQIVADNFQSGTSRSAAALALAQRLENDGCFEEAFAAAVEGNAIARNEQLARNIKYDEKAFVTKVNTIIDTFTSEYFATRANGGVVSELPVFIVGFPRSGTTLVEQICASHSSIFGAGELPDIRHLAEEIRKNTGDPLRWQAGLIKKAARAQLRRLSMFRMEASRVVDKALDNTYELGLIATLFPHCRVIFCHRDGRDAALSVFFNRFAQEAAFATDLREIGLRWYGAERLMDHWRKTLPIKIYQVQYEALVSNFELESRNLINFLGLPWQPACLEFHKTNRTITTPSNWQVRQPLYSTSIGRWRNYRRHLGPLCDAIHLPLDAADGARPTYPSLM